MHLRVVMTDHRSAVGAMGRLARDRGALSIARELERVFGSVSSYAVFCLDAAGIIVTWNPGVRGILDYSRDQFVGRHFSMIFTDEDRQAGAPQNEITRALRTGEACDDRWHVRRDGIRVFVAGVVTPIRDDSGEVQGFLKVIRDRTRFLESAVRLRERRNQAESANREKDAFVAVLAHELRQPLTAIVGWARMGETGRVPPSRVREVFGRILRAADATIHFVNDILDVSRIESGKLQLVRERTVLAPIVQDAVSESTGTADARGVALRLETADTCAVSVDPVRFRQVVTNLVGNAVKYTPRGGSVRVSLRAERGDAVLTVADTGIGIAEQDLPVIFERFRQSTTADRRQSGLGLGLWVARHVVQRHGGTITAISDGPGRGATFVVRIPCEADRRSAS